MNPATTFYCPTCDSEDCRCDVVRMINFQGGGRVPEHENPADTIDTIDTTPSNGLSVDTVDSVGRMTCLPLRRYGTVPSFPSDALPPWLGDYVRSLSQFAQVPVDLPAVFALSTVSALIARRVVVQVKPGWNEPTNLFSAAVMESGEKKSPMHRRVTQPLRDLEAELLEKAAPDVYRARTDREIAKAQAAQALAEAGKAKEVDRLEKEEAAREAAVRAEEVEVPALPRLIADDVTPEALVSLLAEQKGRMAVIAPEGTLFEVLKGRYSKDSNVEAVLKAHAGDEIRVDRKGRAPERVEDPALTIALAIQPEVLAGLGTRPELRGKGFLARWAWSMPESFVGFRNVDPEPLSEDVERVYSAKMKALGHALQGSDRVPISFSPEATGIFRTWRQEIEQELRPGARLDHLRDWGNKLAGLTARIAGALHFAEHGQPGLSLRITGETTTQAIRIGRYFMAHAERVFDFMGADPDIGKALHVLRWIETKRLGEFTKRDAHRALEGTFRKVADLEPALELLTAYAWIEEVPTAHSGVGRKPSPRYRVNTPTEPTISTQRKPL